MLHKVRLEAYGLPKHLHDLNLRSIALHSLPLHISRHDQVLLHQKIRQSKHQQKPE